MRRAFTILELLVVVLTIAIVVCLTLPTMGDLRWRAQELKSIANLRGQAAVMATYTTDERDYFPYFTNPNAHLSVVRGAGLAVPIPHFFSFWTWNVALADNYFGGVALPDSLRIPWLREHDPFTMYWYGDCFVSRPDFWRHETRRRGPSQWGATTAAEVQFPSQKGLLLELGWRQGRLPGSPGTRPRFNLVDGSAREFADGELLPPIPDGVGIGFGSISGSSAANTIGLPVMHTVDGVFGRDVR